MTSFPMSHVSLLQQTSDTSSTLAHGAMNTPILLQPHSWKSVMMTLTLPKWGLGSPSRLPKLQSSIVGVKTPRLEGFIILLESSLSVDVENGLA
jgi:hypothetical protein